LNETWFKLSFVKEILNVKTLTAALAILVTAVMAGNAQVSTVPVGYVTHSVKANSDQRIGLPMQRPSVFTGASTTVNNAIVSAAGITSLSGANFLVVTSGTAEGKWEEISSSTTGSVTLTASIPGFVSGNSFEIKPFWTLGTLLPSGGGIPASPDPYDPVAFVFLYNPAATGINISSSKTYFYHSGSADFAAGWYDNDNVDQPQNDVVLSPEVGLTIRNTTASKLSIPIVGTVPAEKMALDVVRRTSGRQDNILYNKFPADVTLGNSGLADSGAVLPSADVYNPGDQILMYPLGRSGYNGSASASYLYFAGDINFTAGWYDSSNPDGGLKNSVVIPAGAQLVIRKAAGTSGTVAWNPPIPYIVR
jgi:uncharacterized protein (TIGR02597 family)